MSKHDNARQQALSGKNYENVTYEMMLQSPGTVGLGSVPDGQELITADGKTKIVKSALLATFTNVWSAVQTF